MPKYAIGYPALPKAHRAKTIPKPFKFKVARPVGAGIVARAEAPGGTLMEESMIINGEEAQSVNEWYIYKALISGGIPASDIEYQVPWHGGRAFGGQMLDFVINLGGLNFVIRIMGKYWHSEPITSALDTFTYGQMISEGLSVHDIPDTAATSVEQARHALIQEGILH
jgi:hypothetical protein